MGGRACFTRGPVVTPSFFLGTVPGLFAKVGTGVAYMFQRNLAARERKIFNLEKTEDERGLSVTGNAEHWPPQTRRFRTKSDA